MARWTRVVPAVLALGLAASAVPAHAATAGACSWTSTVRAAPGLTFAAKDFTFALEGVVGPCRMPNGETRTGKIVATQGKGHGGCDGAQVETPFAVDWDGGRKRSTGQASGVTSGPFGFITGRLDGGDYAGTPFETFFSLNPQGPLRCWTTGVTSAELYGQITFR